jgi:hypothetical protein
MRTGGNKELLTASGTGIAVACAGFSLGVAACFNCALIRLRVDVSRGG